jgi:hypothetical protein
MATWTAYEPTMKQEDKVLTSRKNSLLVWSNISLALNAKKCQEMRMFLGVPNTI